MGFIEGLVDAISRAQDAMLKNTEKPALEIPEKLTSTQKKLAEMFMEHVPTHILDSGGAYGYRYQRNRKNPIWKKPESNATFSVYGDGRLSVCLTRSTYHLLSNQLTYNEEWDKKFQEWRKQIKDGEWEEHLSEFPHPETGDPCANTNGGWYDDCWNSDYTYNSETLLDTDFIYYKYDSFVIIQIHNGCDARWGFTEPVLFEMNYCDDFNPWEGASIRCSECNAYWDYDTTYCYSSSDDDKCLDKDYPAEKGESGKKGVVVVTEEGKAFCPVCGKGVLE